METTGAIPARPPVVSQTEWDAGLTALLERERNLAAAMHELAAARNVPRRSSVNLPSARSESPAPIGNSVNSSSSLMPVSALENLTFTTS